jgi:hypothetical protein
MAASQAGEGVEWSGAEVGWNGMIWDGWSR